MRPVQDMTPSQVREAAHDAIIRELGVSGLIRYLKDQSLGSGDYTRDRRGWLPEHADAAALFADIDAEAKAMKARGELP